ncbi:MAG: hypothetical protein ACYTHJ_08220 [Planctomycetota bacterium]|jgi:type II secretory pathway pseudopilin PulG
MSYSQHATRRASSIIELLVVVSIIAVLFGMLIPSLQRSISLVRTTMCQNNLREVSHSLHIYRVENEGWLPVSAPVQDSIVAQVGSESQEPNVWFMKLYPDYLKNPEHLSCPEDPFGFRLKQGRDFRSDPGLTNYASYGINSFIMTGGKGVLANVDRFEPSRPGDTILLADLGPDDVSGGSRDPRTGGLVPSRNESLLSWGDDYDIFEGTSDPWITSRHKKGINVVTLGGGVRHVDTKPIISRAINDYYDECDDGGCTLCRELSLYHYTFAHRRLFWWTGALPELASSRIGS